MVVGTGNRSTMRLSKSLVRKFGAGMVFALSFAYLILLTNYLAVSLNPSELFEVSTHVNDSKMGVRFYEALRGNASWTALPVPPPPISKEAHSGEEMEAKRLAKQVRVLCWIMTGPSNHEKKALHVKNTWGKRCNKLIFMSSQSDEKLGAVGLPNTKEGRDWLWAKTKEAFKYVWERHRDEADWFMKADDDTYVIVENLRLMLSQFDPADPVYFGCRFKHDSYVKQGYMSGGAGYVLSREALRRFVEQALPEKSKCRQSPGGSEDLEIGRCLEKVGVRAGDSRDTFGRHRFLALSPSFYLVPGKTDPSFWYRNKIYYPQTKGMGCCSEVAISFHYIHPSQMYVMEYLIYHLRLFGSIPRSHWRQEVKEKVKADSSSNIAKVDSTLSERENVTLISNDSGGNT